MNNSNLLEKKLAANRIGRFNSEINNFNNKEWFEIDQSEFKNLKTKRSKMKVYLMKKFPKIDTSKFLLQVDINKKNQNRMTIDEIMRGLK